MNERSRASQIWLAGGERVRTPPTEAFVSASAPIHGNKLLNTAFVGENNVEIDAFTHGNILTCGSTLKLAKISFLVWFR